MGLQPTRTFEDPLLVPPDQPPREDVTHPMGEGLAPSAARVANFHFPVALGSNTPRCKQLKFEPYTRPVAATPPELDAHSAPAQYLPVHLH